MTCCLDYILCPKISHWSWMFCHYYLSIRKKNNEKKTFNQNRSCHHQFFCFWTMSTQSQLRQCRKNVTQKGNRLNIFSKDFRALTPLRVIRSDDKIEQLMSGRDLLLATLRSISNRWESHWVTDTASGKKTISNDLAKETLLIFIQHAAVFF